MPEPTTITEARQRAAELVALVRERGFKDGGPQFSDAQIWQAILDSADWGAHLWDAASGKLLEHVIEGRTPPSAPQYPVPASDKEWGPA